MQNDTFQISTGTKIVILKARVRRQCFDLKMAANTSRSFFEFIFMLGYQQREFPRWFRRLVGRTELHRAWLSGYTGAGLVDVDERWTASQSF
jgi:hypothetical protein